MFRTLRVRKPQKQVFGDNMYICLEGIDGSGKSTQVLLLEKWLEEYGFEVKRVFEPTDLPVGKLIRKM
ncbi:MAG: dTMP kinase, partial [Methanobacterium sp.]